MYKVLVTARSFGKADDRAIKLLKENDCEVIRLPEDGEENMRDLLEKEIVTADGVIAGLEEYDKNLIDSAGRLKVISRYGVGYDKVDVEAARSKNIIVTITPGANGDSVADLAVALMLDVARNVTVMDDSFKSGEKKRPQGVELWGKTLGIIDAGRIGQGVARRSRGFNMEILCYDIYPNESFREEVNAKYVSLEELIRNSDFISIHSPLTDETRNMIGEKELKEMKQDAIIVNTARGGIIDEEALYYALKNGEIRGAALDALADEHKYPDKLVSLPNCILTPHAGAATKEAVSRMSYMAAENLIEVLKTGKCRYAV